MKIAIKDLGIPMDVKSRGVEYEVKDPKGKHLGDFIVTSTRIVWCPGRTQRQNGKAVTWEKFIAFMNGNGE